MIICDFVSQFCQNLLLANNMIDEGDFLKFTLLYRLDSIFTTFYKASIKFKF